MRKAVAHDQFEAIHPFLDGNGRPGRVWNTLMLVERGLLQLPILYLSRFLIAHRAEHYRRFLDVTVSGSFEAWILFVLAGITETSTWTIAKIDAIGRMLEETYQHLHAHARGLDSRELIGLLFRKPYCRIGDVVEAGLVGRQAASRQIQRLVDLGLPREERSARERLFVQSR